MPPEIITAPERSNSFSWSEDDVNATLTLFGQLKTGQMVALDPSDQPQKTAAKARTRADKMRDQIAARDGAIAAGWKVRTHAVPVGQPNDAGKYPGYRAAVSLVRDPDAEPAPSEPDADGAGAGEPGTADPPASEPQTAPSDPSDVPTNPAAGDAQAPGRARRRS